MCQAIQHLWPEIPSSTTMRRFVMATSCSLGGGTAITFARDDDRRFSDDDVALDRDRRLDCVQASSPVDLDSTVQHLSMLV